MSKKSIDDFIIIAHRGASEYEPENTFSSFDKAVELGAQMIEFDVRLSLDNKLVVVHDPRVNRTTNGKGRVRDKTAYELLTLDAGEGNRIPLVEEIFKRYSGKVKFVIELKDYDTEEPVLRLIEKYGMIEDIYIVSFSKRILKKIKYLEPKVTTGLIKLLPTNIARDCKDCGADVIAVFRYFINKKLIESTKRDNLLLFAWTVNDPVKCVQFKKMGLTGVVTNKPDILN
jgi:glycerophosphoryl diester phosphodiesterase